MACTRFLLQGRQLHKEESEICLSCTRHTYWSSSLSLPNIKLSQTVWELWPAQDFGFRGENYIMKTVRVVILARNIPTGLLLHFYQTLSKYVLRYQSYDLQKISASGEITIQWIKWELSLLHATRLLSSSSSLPNIMKLSQTVWELWPVQDFGFKEDSESCLSCTQHTNSFSFSYLPNITKICLRVSKLWSAQGLVQFQLQGR